MRLLISYQGVMKILPKCDNYEQLIKFIQQSFSNLPSQYQVKYKDADQDLVSLCSQQDIDIMIETVNSLYVKAYIEEQTYQGYEQKVISNKKDGKNTVMSLNSDDQVDYTGDEQANIVLNKKEQSSPFLPLQTKELNTNQAQHQVRNDIISSQDNIVNIPNPTLKTQQQDNENLSSQQESQKGDRYQLGGKGSNQQKVQQNCLKSESQEENPVQDNQTNHMQNDQLNKTKLATQDNTLNQNEEKVANSLEQNKQPQKEQQTIPIEQQGGQQNKQDQPQILQMVKAQQTMASLDKQTLQLKCQEQSNQKAEQLSKIQVVKAQIQNKDEQEGQGQDKQQNKCQGKCQNKNEDKQQNQDNIQAKIQNQTELQSDINQQQQSEKQQISCNPNQNQNLKQTNTNTMMQKTEDHNVKTTSKQRRFVKQAESIILQAVEQVQAASHQNSDLNSNQPSQEQNQCSSIQNSAILSKDINLSHKQISYLLEKVQNIEKIINQQVERKMQHYMPIMTENIKKQLLDQQQLSIKQTLSVNKEVGQQKSAQTNQQNKDNKEAKIQEEKQLNKSVDQRFILTQKCFSMCEIFGGSFYQYEEFVQANLKLNQEELIKNYLKENPQTLNQKLGNKLKDNVKKLSFYFNQKEENFVNLVKENLFENFKNLIQLHKSKLNTKMIKLNKSVIHQQNQQQFDQQQR